MLEGILLFLAAQCLDLLVELDLFFWKSHFALRTRGKKNTNYGVMFLYVYFLYTF